MNDHDNYEIDTYAPKKKNRRGAKIAMMMVVMVAVSAGSIAIYKGTTESLNTNTTPQQTASQQASSQPSSSPTNNTNNTLTDKNVVASNSKVEDMAVPDVAEKLIESVVCIQSYTNRGSSNGFLLDLDDFESNSGQLYSEGSGIILSEDGYIVTNAHVIEDADSIKVILSDDTIYEAKVVGTDEATDLAVLKVEANGLKKAELGNSDDLRTGETVIAIGNPGGLKFSSSVSRGIVSAKDRPIQYYGNHTMNTIQTDAAINPGNSGGALVNLAGQVVGINSAKYGQVGYEGLGFAITINDAIPIINDLMQHGYVKNRAKIGITCGYVDTFTAAYNNVPTGIIVDEVTNPNAGDLKRGDIITHIDGERIETDVDLKDFLMAHKPGDKIELTIHRRSQEGSSKEVKTTLTLMEASDN